jgi:hypothetical protein
MCKKMKEIEKKNAALTYKNKIIFKINKLLETLTISNNASLDSKVSL